jgi:hypothetical protein
MIPAIVDIENRFRRGVQGFRLLGCSVDRVYVREVASRFASANAILVRNWTGAIDWDFRFGLSTGISDSHFRFELSIQTSDWDFRRRPFARKSDFQSGALNPIPDPLGAPSLDCDRWARSFMTRTRAAGSTSALISTVSNWEWVSRVRFEPNRRVVLRGGSLGSVVSHRLPEPFQRRSRLGWLRLRLPEMAGDQAHGADEARYRFERQVPNPSSRFGVSYPRS